MPSADGKFYKTYVATAEQLFRLIQSIPSLKAEPFKLWIAQVAKRGGNVAKTARKQLEKELGHSIISPENAKSLGISGSAELPFDDKESK